MSGAPMPASRRRVLRWLTLFCLAAAIVAGCVQIQRMPPATPPGVSARWQPLLTDLRAFSATFGFKATRNFALVDPDVPSFPFCGHTPRTRLPWSYEDPAIVWRDSVSEEECRAVAPQYDVYFGASEAVGESATPVTQSMLETGIDRFVYLVVHEDCHDQFNLPFGIEEPLCELITYRAMDIFAGKNFRWYSPERRAIKSYAERRTRQAFDTIRYYDLVAALYARHQRGEIDEASALRDRAPVFARAEKSLELQAGAMNNVLLANHMTYSRHYPLVDRAWQAVGRDLGRLVEFFRAVDAAKPTPEEVLRRHAIAERRSVEFMMVYEQAVVETAEGLLAKSAVPGKPR